MAAEEGLILVGPGVLPEDRVQFPRLHSRRGASRRRYCLLRLEPWAHSARSDRPPA